MEWLSNYCKYMDNDYVDVNICQPTPWLSKVTQETTLKYFSIDDSNTALWGVVLRHA